MNEELNQKAEKNAEKFFGKPTDLVDLDKIRIFKNGYIAGATEATKELSNRLEAQKETIASYDADLNKAKEQIEKMKCCGNCKHHRYDYGELECVTKGCENKCKWELAE